MHKSYFCGIVHIILCIKYFCNHSEKKSHFGIRRLKKNPYIVAENTKTQLSYF